MNSMEKNAIFCFTGTGNSLKAAMDIAADLENCSIFDMGHIETDVEILGFSRIGFVFPVYFLGLPLKVAEFIEKLHVPADFNGYFFSIGTYANVSGVAVKQVDAILRKHGQRLNYADYIKMGDNAIAFYGSHPKPEKLAASYERDMSGIIPKIKDKATIRTGVSFWPMKKYHNAMIPRMRERDKGFQLSDACSHCGVCAELCPVDNIDVKDGKPDFRHGCEQCMACIQLCPQKAIDYKGKCAGRNRYKHPHISVNDLIEFHTKPDAISLF
jgi:ferredoxin